MTFPMPFISPQHQVAVPADVQFVQTYTRAAAQNHSQSCAIGAAAGGRSVFVVLVWSVGGAGPAPNLVSVTIGGVSAAVHVVRRGTIITSGNFGVAIASAVVPSGTSATVAISFSASAAINRLSTYRVTGLQSTTPLSTDSDQSIAFERTLTLPVEKDGMLIAADVHYGTTTVVSGFGLDQQTQIGVSAFYSLIGHAETTATQSARNLTFQISTGNPSQTQSGIAVAASFR